MGRWVLVPGMGIPEFTKDAADRLINNLGENEWYQCQCTGAVHTCVGMAGWSNDRPPATGTWTADDDWDGPMELN
jgi:hypothetical protein